MTKPVIITKAEIKRRIKAAKTIREECDDVSAVVFGDNGEMRLEFGTPESSDDPVGKWLSENAGADGGQSAS